MGPGVVALDAIGTTKRLVVRADTIRRLGVGWGVRWEWHIEPKANVDGRNSAGILVGSRI